MAIDKLAHDFLTRLNSVVKQKVTVVLIGGNALTLLGLKKATEDIDIICRSTDPIVANFCREYPKRYKIKVDFFIDGLFKNIRIKDYLVSAYPHNEAEFPNIELKILNLHNILLMKIARFLPRDLDDVAKVLSLTDVNEKDLDQRFRYLIKYTMGDKTDFVEKYENFKRLYGNLLKS